MKRTVAILLLALAWLAAFPRRSPAPLVYRPGVGWTYESPATKGQWRKTRAKEQYQFALDAFQGGDYKLAAKAARYCVDTWPLSDYAPDAQYLLGRCYEARERFEKAFKEYQKLIEKHPKYDKYEEVLLRQFEIANRFLAGRRFRLWGLFPLYRSMEKTVEMYVNVIGNGPYSRIAPLAQLNIGVAREKQKDYVLAVDAYSKAADLYHDKPLYAAEALYREAMAWYKQAKTSEYDQSAASQAIGRFTDFSILYPSDPRVEEVRRLILQLKEEQAKGALRIARFYEKRRKILAARIYYNEVIAKAPDSEFAKTARERLAALKAPQVASPEKPAPEGAGNEAASEKKP